jgi:hypothetical protein
LPELCGVREESAPFGFFRRDNFSEFIVHDFS